MGIWEMSAWQMIKSGGPLMWPIIICSVVAVAIVVEKLIYFQGIRTDTHQLKTAVFELIKDNRVQDAVQLCQKNPSPLAKILKAGILKSGESRESIKETMEDVSLFEIPKLEKRLTALSTVAQASPLLGLLGTVAGMCTSFHTIQMRSVGMNPVTPGDLAGGIWEALLTTVAGLMVAIPAFVFYNYLVSRINAIVLEMERGATELLNFLCHLGEVNRAARDI